jgi:hypothetical protein
LWQYAGVDRPRRRQEQPGRRSEPPNSFGCRQQPTYDIVTAAKILQGKKKGEKAVFNIVVERTRGNFFRRDTLQTAVTVR